MFGRIFDNMEQFRRTFDRFFQSQFGPISRWYPSEGTSEWTFTPAVETGWTDTHLNLRVVVPGVGQEDFSLTVQGNQLQIRGERRAPENFGSEGYTYRSIPYGKFERAVDLPNGLELDKLEARLHDGVLDIHIPLAAEVKPRKVPILVGEERKKIAA